MDIFGVWFAPVSGFPELVRQRLFGPCWLQTLFENHTASKLDGEGNFPSQEIAMFGANPPCADKLKYMVGYIPP